MIQQKVRKVGNSLVITLPKDEAERLGIHEGDLIGYEPYKLEVRPVLSPDLRAAAERSWQKSEAAYRYLADR